MAENRTAGFSVSLTLRDSVDSACRGRRLYPANFRQVSGSALLGMSRGSEAARNQVYLEGTGEEALGLPLSTGELFCPQNPQLTCYRAEA